MRARFGFMKFFRGWRKIPRYSHASREAREVGLQMLDASSGYEELVGDDRFELAMASLVSRGRRLLRSAYRLADAGQGLEAAVLLRSLTEYAFTVRWLGRDPELNLLRWLMDGVTRIVRQDEELRRLERRRRRDAGLPTPGPTDEPLGLLLPEMRTRLRETRHNLRGQLAAVEGIEDRIEPAREGDDRSASERAETLPDFRVQANLTGLEYVYALTYTFDSLAIAHPNSLAAEQLLEFTGEQGQVAVAAEPTRTLPDPYATGAALFALALDAAGDHLPELQVGELPGFLARLAELRPFDVGGAG